MSDAPVSQATPAAPEGGGGFFQNLVDLYFSPGAAFSRIVRAPGFWLPAALMLAVSFGFFAVWLQKMDVHAFMKTQIEEGPWADRIPPERKAEIIEQQSERFPKWGWVNVAIATPGILLVVGGVLFFVFRFFYASEVSFKQALSIVAWTFLAVGLVTQPLTLAVMAMKGDWNINPQDALQANPGLLLDPQTAAKPLLSLLGSLDLFSFWIIFLLATGFAVASRKATGSALWGVAIPWAVFVAIKVGWAAL
jgi:hypothetical protein